MPIPKIIHYCWFGKKPLPADCRKALAAWKKQLPDYEIMRWDESSFDVTESDYVRAAYDAGKYAFVSDYMRLYALKKYGGVYLDTDIEITRDFTPLLSRYNAVFGFESGEKVMTAFMAAQPDSPIINEFLEYYATQAFDASNLTPNTVILTDILERRGLVINNQTQALAGDVIVFPLDYFQAYDFSAAALCTTDNTYTIHKCFGSWCSPKERLIFAAKRFLGKHLSEENYRRLKQIKKKIAGE